MKTQPSSTIMTRLCWCVFFLVLLFLGFQVIPRALGQRTIGKRSGAAHAPKVAQSATRSIDRSQAQTATGSVKIDSSQLPYDRPRSAVQAGPVSQFPTKTSGPVRVPTLRILPQPKLPQVVLYDQYNNASANASLSATFTDFPTFSSDLADDFVVPGGQTWNVESIDADGVYFNGFGPANSWNVFIYTESSTLPGGRPCCWHLLDRDPGQHDLRNGGRVGLDRSNGAS